MAKRPLVAQYEALMRGEDQAKPTNGSAPSNASPDALLSSLQRDGFVKVPTLLSPHMLLALRGAAAYVTQRARAGKWPNIRTVPKQFPPWPSAPPEQGIWGVQHLLHPEMPVRELFAEIYFSDAVLGPVKELLGCGDEGLVMELFNLLVSPPGDFELVWHRDDVRADLSPDEEVGQLESKSPGRRQAHAQYNIALTEDESLVVVPGSHRRARTEREREAGPYEVLEGEVRVQLHPGDAVFYDSNILHRGVYKGVDPKEEIGRLTLHGSVGLAGHSRERARQVLQHVVGEWIERAKFGPEGSNLERAEAMRKRLVAMGRGEDLGFSLEG